MQSMTNALQLTKNTHIREPGVDGITDRSVVKQVIQGDRDAFSVLVSRYQDRIYSVVLNYVGNPEDAIDITQEAFVKAYSKLSTLMHHKVKIYRFTRILTSCGI